MNLVGNAIAWLIKQSSMSLITHAGGQPAVLARARGDVHDVVPFLDNSRHATYVRIRRWLIQLLSL